MADVFYLTRSSPPAGLGPAFADVLIVPLAVSAFALKVLLRSALRLLVDVLDWTFPVVMQAARVPLFLARVTGDMIAAALRASVRLLPLDTTRRQELQAIIARQWARIRRHISYRAFEEALHHAFERGMTWVFHTCRDLTPRSALLVICGAAMWFPISFGTSTVMHAFLLAHATTLPTWMQLFHFPVALMAKSKILVLPVYPAAWPQAKRHPFVLGAGALYGSLKGFAVIQRLARRYRQTELGGRRLAMLLAKAYASFGAAIGLHRATRFLSRRRRDAANWWARRTRAAALRFAAAESRLWLIGPHLRRLAIRYANTAPLGTAKPSEKIRSVYARWAVKFTPSYYEAKDPQVARSQG